MSTSVSAWVAPAAFVRRIRSRSETPFAPITNLLRVVGSDPDPLAAATAPFWISVKSFAETGEDLSPEERDRYDGDDDDDDEED